MDASVRDARRYEFGSFVLDPIRRVLTHDGVPVVLSPTLFDTLLYFVEHPGRVVSKDELMDAIWPRRVVEDANISQTIFTLRRALAEAGAHEQLITTAPRQGYRFASSVHVQAHMTAATAGARLDQDDPFHRQGDREDPRAPSRTVPRLGIGVAVLVGAVLLVIVGGFLALRPRASSPGPVMASLVVLADFQNSTGDPIFDRTLDRVLQIDLEQSPFVTILPQRQIKDTLALMAQAQGQRLTTALAGEVCVRNNGQAVIEGSVASLGARYLLTLTATDCSSDKVLAAEKAEIDSREAVIPALDRMIGRIRGRLGESKDSVARFSVPIMNEKTASLAALKAYSEGCYLSDHGDNAKAIALFQHAIDLDPSFPAAYSRISASYFNIDQRTIAKSYMSKAYALKDTANEELKLNISILYNTYVANNYSEVIRTARAMTEIYPRQGSAWINLSNAENWLGRYPAAIEAGQHAVDVAPGRESSYVVLARALMHADRLDEAAAICARSTAKGLAGGQTAGLMMEISIARGDQAAINRQIEAARGKPYEGDILIFAARDAYHRGQVRRGDDLYARAAALFTDQGASDPSVSARAADLAELGLKDQARQLIAQLPADTDPENNLLTLALIGDAAHARANLERALRQGPADTLLNAVFAPEARAALALRQSHPAEAVSDLRPALNYEARDDDTPYLSGRAYLAAGDGVRAAIEFHKIIDHPGVEPADVLHPLAQLGLARAYALQRLVPASRKAYEQVFADWKGADPDLPPLREARAEYAKLGGSA